MAMTDWRPVREIDRTRVRIDGFPKSSNSCRIQYSTAQWTPQDVLLEPDTRNRDLEMELDLMSVLDPEGAQRIAAGAEAAAAGRTPEPAPAPEPAAEPTPEPNAELAPAPEPTP